MEFWIKKSYFFPIKLYFIPNLNNTPYEKIEILTFEK
jgi:hypothetical protein